MSSSHSSAECTSLHSHTNQHALPATCASPININNNNSSTVATTTTTMLGAFSTTLTTFLPTTFLIVVMIVIIFVGMLILWKRRLTRSQLEGGKCNLPTVVWRPRFMNYTDNDDEDELEDDDRDDNVTMHDDTNGNGNGEDDDTRMMLWARRFLNKQQQQQQQHTTLAMPTSSTNSTAKTKKMASSSITNILPRMDRLAGPYGMYATVYGISTKVVHIAHPVPARAILSGSGVVDDAIINTINITKTQSSIQSPKKKSTLQKRKRSNTTLRLLTGSTKNPAYDHFQNFSGNGVFTANGADWKAKRASVLHCLLKNTNTNTNNGKGNGSNDGNGSNGSNDDGGGTLLEIEANRAADSFEREVAHYYHYNTTAKKMMNVVPMLQRSTIGLIYRIITHHNVEFGPGCCCCSSSSLDHHHDTNNNNACQEEDDPDSSSSISSLLSSSSPRCSATSLAYLNNEAETTIANENDGGEEEEEEVGGVVCKHLKKGNASTDKGPNMTINNINKNNTNNNKNNSNINKETIEKEAQIKTLLPTYLDSVTKIRMIILAQSRSFWYLVPRWVYRTFSPMYREEERTMQPIREFARLTCENALPGSPLALLSQRNSHSSSSTTTTSGAAAAVSDDVSKDLLDEAITLLFAGQDTSAATLSWTLHLLSLHPEKQQRVAEEVRSVILGATKASDDQQSSTTASSSVSRESTTATASATAKMTDKITVSKGMISQMPYLDAVIKESMRLYPVAPFIVRKLTTDITIPMDKNVQTKNSSNTISLPSSTFALIWIYSLHRNPLLWNQPDDFLPERWIQPEVQCLDRGQSDHGSYMPFAMGPRNCLGQPLAQVILRILLARILNKFVVVDPKWEALCKLAEREGGDTVVDSKWLRKDMQAGFTVLPSNGLKLKLMERV